MIHFVHKLRKLHMISHETVTPLNYRMTVSGRSDFLANHNFPEVYHGHGITTAPFYGGERPITGKVRDTAYSVMVSWEYRYILCCRAAARRGPESRSGTAGNRISEEKKKSCCKISTKNGGLLRYGNYCSVGKIQNRVSLKLQKTGQKNFFQLIFINRP